MKNIWIFASGSIDWWGSGARKILEKVKTGEITGIENITLITNHARWWVYKVFSDFIVEQGIIPGKLRFHHIPHFPKRNTNWEFDDNTKEEIREIYISIMHEYDLEYIFLSWWLKYVLWLPVEKTINIHPWPTQAPYGWNWMHGGNVHKKVWEDYKNWNISQSCVTMHFVTDKIDRGPIICQIPVDISNCQSDIDVGRAVNAVEHEWQWKITNMIVNKEIYLDSDGTTIHYPEGFPYKWALKEL